MKSKFGSIISGFPNMIHGANYNPDQWIKYDPDIIQKDMELMRKANMNSMSVGIFSWASIEPEEGVNDFSFLDESMDRIGANSGKEVLATPSGSRPRWMAQRYPEVLRVAADGSRNWYGGRHNHCYSSPVYRAKIRAANEQLSIRYKDHPALGIWHISN